ncbi:hypothetical protein BLFGPEAP_00478 [Candidatus Methanoperedenaceae archaeon GB50]|nr:hypothetical protein BLFGPEAP_00478 [Candidatus Methanoperedenaceae archaeon GB50]
METFGSDDNLDSGTSRTLCSLIQKLKPALKEEISEEIIRNYSKLDVVIIDPSLILNGIAIKRDSLIVAAAQKRV